MVEVIIVEQKRSPVQEAKEVVLIPVME